MIFVSSGRTTKASVANAQSLDPGTAWRQLVARDRNAQFVYAVTTTGIYCRPGCASRRPLRRNVRFFGSPAEASAAGFRPCLRCRPTATATTVWGSVLDRVRAYLETHLDRRVSLGELGRVAGLSPFTVQRLFKREMGASPLAYQRALRAGRLRRALKQGDSVTDAVYNAGFSSSSRAYEGAPLGMTPARFAQGGRGEEIAFASAASPFGWMVAGATARGLCWLSLASTRAEAEDSLRVEFPQAELRRDSSLARWIEAAVGAVAGKKGAATSAATQLPDAGQALDLRGTGISTARLAGAAADSARRDAQLQPVGAGAGRPAGDARRGPRLRCQSRGPAGAVPSRGGRGRRAHRLPMGHRAQAEAAGQ